MTEKILLGFEVGTGSPVFLPLHHLAIFGMTQLSGKTTTLEALISRSGLRAIAFITKRGEKGFTKFRLIPPYYKPRADWQFVEGLVNVALGEKVKYEPGMRWAIIKVSKGAKSLKDVKAKAEEMLVEAKRDFQKQLFEKLITYLEIVVPELERWHFSDKLELDEGVNVMDLSMMRTETQHLVIASTIEYAFQNLDHVIIIIPEAWETLPEHKMTPVKWVAEQFIRKGAAIGNYMWIDSQDIGGLSKVPLRQCDIWLMGRMKEAHEVERILKQLLGMKVRAEEIQTLPLGHFFAVIGDEVKKVYVLPAGVPEEVGRQVALGKLTPEYVRDTYLKPRIVEVDEELVWKERYEEEKRRREELEKLIEAKVKEAREQAYKEAMMKVEELKRQWNVEEYQKTIAQLKDEKAALESALKQLEPLKAFGEALARFLQSLNVLGVEPASQKVLDVEHKELVVNILHKGEEIVKVSTDTVVGQILYTALTYFKDREFTFSELSDKMLEHGWNVKASTLSAKLSLLVNEGKLIKTDKGYRLPQKVKFNIGGI